MSRTVYLDLPASEEAVRALEMGDIVYLKGRIFTSRDRAYARAVERLEKGERLPMDYNQGALWHCGPIMSKDEAGNWQLEAAGATTSSRFSARAAYLIRALHQRVTLGKGTMNPEAVEAMKEVGAVFLSSTGGCAALYAEQIKRVAGVNWLDLEMCDAVWEFETECMGPFIVNIDSRGNSLYEKKRKEVKEKIRDYYRRAGIDGSYDYSYLPKRTPGRTLKNTQGGRS